MQRIQLTSQIGDTYFLTIPEPLPTLEKAYLFAYAKSGSTLLNNLITQYAKRVGFPTLSIFNQAFDQGIRTMEIGGDCKEYIEQPGIIYTGFRHYPGVDLDLSGVKVVMLVRDPRDMLVSMYYSITKSHRIPKKNEGLAKQREEALTRDIDEDVLIRARSYLSQFLKYKEKLKDTKLKTYRYEDIIYKKQEWLGKLVNFLALPQDKALVAEVAQRFDKFPKQEMVDQHIRQVHPGNYKDKLRKDTVDSLNSILEEFLTYYQYEM